VLLEHLVLVAVGGAVGSAARYLVAVGAVRALGGDFPYGTLFVNVAGSFAIGVVQELAFGAALLPERARLLLATGVMGGFTTYSAFAWETVRLAETGAWTRVLLNVAATTGACVVFCVLGIVLVRTVIRPA
jgi:CrcB protein